MALTFATKTAASIPLFVVSQEGFPDWVRTRSEPEISWLEAVGFTGALGSVAFIPGNAGAPLSAAIAGIGTTQQRARGRFVLAAAQPKLPTGTFHLADGTGELDADEAALGWLLADYRFDRYKSGKTNGAALIPPADINPTRLEAIAKGEALTRDLINTPASDMGPDALQDEAQKLADAFGANCSVVAGDDLLSQNFPMIHAVGRAAAQSPRLLDLRWGNTGPSLTLVGKGVCFDTGGLNIKPGTGMGLMKKDMGGAATVLGLAQMIMALDLPLKLRVLIPAVENAISATAMRPGDILTSRMGLTVEINNTDAEGRLVLADALALADEDPPDLLISMATLTGAARVAVGPDIAPFYATDANLANSIKTAGEAVADPVWELPYHTPYEEMIEPAIADLDNAPKGGFAGSITAALFLRRFVEQTSTYAHFDIYGWQPKPAPARPVGGVGQGARAILQALPNVLGL